MPRQERKPRRGAKARSAFIAWDGDEPTIDEARAATCTDPQSRAEYIAELMARQRYVAYRTRRELLRVWSDIGPDRLTQLCTNGAVLNRASLGKCAELTAMALSTIVMVRQQTIHHGEEEYKAGNPLAFKWFEIALQASQGLLAFADVRFDQGLARARDKRDTEKHDRDMRQGVMNGPISLDEVLQAERASKDNAPPAPDPDAHRTGG